MSIINKKYLRLFPRLAYLGDDVVLVQAWKKSQRYIRKINWYADLLELDQSAILLEERIASWQKDIKEGNATPKSMRLVLAPKSHRWGFEKDIWKAIEKGQDGKIKPIKLRPLAHLNIRDQTMSTAAMLCLADCIETAQGDPSLDYFEARRRGVHSYGNRLFCTFDTETLGAHNRPLASFSWGNSETYSLYYKDYRHFQARPIYIAEKIQDQLSEHEELFIVKLDITAFYDRICIATLIERLKREYIRFQKNYSPIIDRTSKQFWECLKQIMKWDWCKEDCKNKYFLRDDVMPKGIPQGMVASGFFANAYMLEFDRFLNSVLEQPFGNNPIVNIEDDNGTGVLPDYTNITLYDYCRYVDDIRLVISLKRRGAVTEKGLADQITKWMNYWLCKKAHPQNNQIDCKTPELYKLAINHDKTEVIPFRFVASQTGVTVRMALIQQSLSGPADMDALREATAGLDELLTEADYFDCCTDPVDEVTHPLAKITNQKSNVRDDTLKRFAAYRLKSTLRRRRSMTDLNVKLETGVRAGDAIDHELETYARKMVRAWSHDPALSLVLRLAMDLFPSPDLLRPVLDALKELLKPSRRKYAKESALVAWYVIADLLKAGAIETGIHARDEEMPATANLTAYRTMLLGFAKQHVLTNKDAPWYSMQQALLLLITLEPCTTIMPRQNIEEIKQYQLLLDSSSYNIQHPFSGDSLVIHMVFQQFHEDKNRFASWLVDSLQGLDDSSVRNKYLEKVSFNRPDLMVKVLEEMDRRNLKWIECSHDYLKIPYGMHRPDRDLSDLDNIGVSLWKIATHQNNPFQHEIPWLRLAKALIKEIQNCCDKKRVENLSLHNIKIKVRKWSVIENLDLLQNDIEIIFDETGSTDPRLEKPDWCDDKWVGFYVLGRLLRSVITGEQDFTIMPYLYRQEWNGYNGMRNSWYTRRMGMTHSPEILRGDDAPFSPWVSELLMRLLQWPGARTETKLIADWEKIQSLEDLLRMINRRLQQMETMYGRASGLSIYPILIEHTPRQAGHLRLLLAQTLLPRQQDFSKLDLCLNHPDYRPIHRNHLSTVCSLILSQLKAQSAHEKDHLKDQSKVLADLIVFPELTVHPDDRWILQRLSDTTKAMLFFGQTPITKNNGKIINTACWLIPNHRVTGRSWVVRYQGKQHLTLAEKKLDIVPWRPYQVIIELPKSGCNERGYRMTGAICYDATDLNLVADLKNQSDLFIVVAMNKDVQTFDNMVAALHYHMYQHIVLVNTGEFGGSTVQAPFKEKYDKVITHLHGGGQIGLSIFDIDMTDFGPGATFENHQQFKKSPPANFTRF